MDFGEWWDSVNDSWQSFLEWAADKGLPLKALADALEEKGVPSLPALILILIAIIGGAALLVLPLLAPPTATIVVTVQGLDGTPLPNVNVYLASAVAEQVFTRMTEITDFEGRVIFRDVPTGTLVSLLAEPPSPEYSSEPVTFTTAAGENPQTLILSRVAIQTVSLMVSVKGPGTASILLFDSSGLQVGDAQTGTDVSFDVSPNQTYSVRIVSAGYREETRQVTVGGSNDAVSVTLYEEGKVALGRVRVGVLDNEGLGNPVANASVRIMDESTGKLLYADATGEDGEMNAIDLPLGSTIVVSASAPSFLARSSAPVTVAEDTPVLVRLPAATPENSKAVQVAVVDADNNQVSDPTVRLYLNGVMVEEKTPADGMTSFDSQAGKATVVAWKIGYLPASASGDKGSHTIVLRTASVSNSGSASVEVSDKDGLPVAGAAIGLFKQDGSPAGVPEQTTGIDGMALFDGLPLIAVLAKASFSGRTGSSAVQEISAGGVTNYSIGLLPGKGKAVFSVIDHYSGSLLDGASVKAVGEDGAVKVCSTKKGKCTVELVEGQATASVALAGYEAVDLGSFAVPGNSEARVGAEMISLSVARNVKLVFAGVYDLNGNKVNSLAPSTHYVAKYLVRDPGVAFLKALAHVRVGPATGAGDAGITGYDAAGARIVAGTDYNVQEFTAPSAAYGNATGANASAPVVQAPSVSSETPAEYKWVNFEFSKFTGTKEVDVQFKTHAVEKGKVELAHRSAFFLANETLRDPSDAAAGVSKAELLAEMNAPVTVPIEFEGQCAGGLCVQAWLEGASGKGASLEPRLGEEFSVKFKAFYEGTATVTVSTSSKSVLLKSGSAAGLGAEAETVEGEQSVVLSVPGKEDGVEGAFALQGTRLAKDAVLQFSVESKDGSRVQKTFSVKVVGEKPALLVSVSPQSIEALAESRIVFKVTDAATGLPVEDAHVVLGSEFDLFKGAVIEAFAANEEGVVGKAKAGAEKGKYVLSVEPNDAGYIDWKVEADGYRTKRGQIDVSANTVMEFEPKTAALAVDSKTFVSSAVSVRNLLASNARVTLSLVRNSPAAYTTIETDRAAFSLKAGESGQFNLRARVNEFVLGVADTPQILKEDVSGTIRVVARAGSAMQTEEIPFTVKTVYAQQGLGELWSMSADSLDFELRPPQYVSRMQPLTVTNNAPHPVVVNFQPMVPTLFITPLSAVVPAGGSQEFQVISTAAREYLYEGCVMEDKQLQGDVFVYATFQGIRSSKKITTTIDIASSDTCSPKDGVQVTLPTGLYFSLPTGTIIKKNTDGSVAFQLPDGLRALIQGGYVSGSEVIAPAGALLVLPPAWLSSTASLTTAAGPVQRLQLVFPFPTRWEIKSGEKLPAYLSTARPIEFDNARITFPPGTQVNDASLPIANGGLGFSPITATTPVNPNAYYAPLIPAGVQNYPYLPSQAYSLLMQNTYYQRDLKHVASVMAGLPVTIEAARGEDSSVIPVTYEQGLPFSFKLEVPGVANMDSATKTIELSQCNRTRVYKGEDLMLVFPAAKRILFPKGGVSFPTAIAAGGRPTSFEVQALKPFTIEYCPGVSGDDKYFTACFQSTTQFMFTEGTEVDRGQYTAVPNTCEKVTLFATDAEKEKEYAGVFVLGASGMRFPPKASLDKSRKTGFLPLTGDAVSSASLLAGACVDFEPCEGFKKGGDLKDKPLVSPAAQFLSVDPKALEFQLSDGKLKESKTVKVLNSGASKLMKVGIYEESLTSQYNDLLIPKETGFAKVVQNAFQPKYDLEGQLKKEGAAGFDYQITVQVPNELKDAHGCIAKSVKIQGRVTIRPENQLAANAVEVPVTVNVAVDEAKCQFAQAKAALAAISDLTVNYGAEEVNDNSPNQKMLLSFKNVGHSRFVTLINNEPAETVAQVGVWPEKNDLLDCKFSKDGKQTDFGDMTEAKPLYIASAGAVILNCTTLTDTGGKPVIYEVNSKDVIVQSKQGGAAPQTVKKKLSVVVYKPEDAVKALYQGTPQGDILRVEKPGFKACEKFYCDYDQAASAFSSLMATLNDYLDKAIIKDDFAKTHAQFCALGVGGDGYRPLQKTITIQLVNSLAVLQFNDAKLRELAGNAFNNQVAGVKVTSPGFKGCGIYKVTATVMAWCGALGEGETWADWKKRTTIQVSAEPLVGCGEYFTPQNALANAAILMRESYEGFSGLQVTHWPSEAIEPIKALLNLKLPFGSMHLGTYKNQTDEKDKQNLNSVFSTLFNSPLQEKGDSRWSFPDYYYPEDQHYCLNSAWSGPLPTFFAELPFVLGAEALATGGAALGGVAASALTLTAPFCAVSVVSPLVSKINWCQAGCGCLTGLWGLLLPLKGAKGIGTFVTDIGAKKLAGLTVLNLGAAVASTATENEYSGEIAGTSFGASFALTKYPEILKGARLELLKKLRRTLVGVTDEEIITITDSLIGTTPDVAAAATAGGGATSAAAFDAARIQVMKAFGKTYGGATLTTEQAKNILAYQTAINKGDVATFEKYLEILEKDGTSGVYDKMKVALAPRISRGGSVVGRRGADLLATVDVTAEQVAQQSAGLIQKIGKSFYLGGAAWKFVAGAAKVGAFLQLLAFNCNLEPVEAKLDPDKLNHAVVFHHETRTFYDEAQRTETGSDPTIYRWSYGNHNELLQANCPPGWKACLKLRYDDFLKDKQLGLQGGLLIIGLGNEVTNPAELLSSVFLPDTAPVKKETLGITEKTSAAVTVAPGAAAESGGGI